MICPKSSLRMECLRSGGAHAPRVWWSAPPPTTSLRLLYFLSNERQQSARAPTATREGACAPPAMNTVALGEDLRRRGSAALPRRFRGSMREILLERVLKIDREGIASAAGWMATREEGAYS